MNQLTSDSRLLDLQHHFRVGAGPGAGKTHWLVEHINNVLARSNNLSKTRKIACITYTNIAVETISKRLNNSSDHVEVSTFHSFLYRNIVKPYIHNIAGEYGINVSGIDGHDNMKVSLGKAKKWIKNHPKRQKLRHPFSENQLTQLPGNLYAIRNWLQSMKCQFTQSENDLEFTCDRSKAVSINESGRSQINHETLEELESNFIDLKKVYWDKGVLHHDDILFFSYKLVERFPYIIEVISSKFPYFFVDEFQDSNPIQVWILKKIGTQGTVVGIIGDKVQSIFEFQGADPSQFYSFDLDDIKDYQIKINRRSTKSIVECLNSIRSDIKQIAIRKKTGSKPLILVGEDANVLNKVKKICKDEAVYSLTRKNITANALKKSLSSSPFESGKFEMLRSRDGNRYRSGVVVSCIKAVELARNNKPKEAIKELKRFFENNKSKDHNRSVTIGKILILLENYEKYCNTSLYDFYKVVRQEVKPNVAKLTNRGSIKSFYEDKTYKEFAVSVIIKDDKSFCKTVHNAKGDEFKNVLIVFEKESDLSIFINNDLQNNEEDRIKYVAISRAQDGLFISVPELSVEMKGRLGDNFEFLYL